MELVATLVLIVLTVLATFVVVWLVALRAEVIEWRRASERRALIASIEADRRHLEWMAKLDQLREERTPMGFRAAPREHVDRTVPDVPIVTAPPLTFAFDDDPGVSGERSERGTLLSRR